MAAVSASIERLQKKLEKEPNSLIFLQLADEYRKEGMYEDALKACRDGLRRHPNYWSARVAMGRIYFEMGDVDKAREELEKVIKAVPDNLLANKILGDVYLETNRHQEALKRYKLVQMLTPADPEVLANIRKIEAYLSGAPAAPVPQAQPTPPPPQSPPPPAGFVATASEPVDLTAVTAEIPAAPLAAPEKALVSALSPEPELPPAPSGVEEPEPPGMLITPIEPPPESITPEVPEPASGEMADLFLTAEEESLGVSFKPAPTAPVASVSLTPEEPKMAEFSVTEMSLPPVKPAESRLEDRTQPIEEEKEDLEEQADELTTQTLAELYFQQGLVDKAIKVYQKLLLNDPNNSQIVQRLRELNPADALLSSAREEKTFSAGASIPKKRSEEAETQAKAKSMEQISEERKKKISTLENWLSSIRRER